MNASPEEIMSGGGQATALEDASPPMSVPALSPVVDAEIVEGWDLPPVGIKVVKNPNPPPKYVPAP